MLPVVTFVPKEATVTSSMTLHAAVLDVSQNLIGHLFCMYADIRTIIGPSSKYATYASVIFKSHVQTY